MALTLLRWMMGENSSTPALSQQSLPKPERGYLLARTWQLVLIYMDPTRRKDKHVEIEFIRSLPVSDTGIWPKHKCTVPGFLGRN